KLTTLQSFFERAAGDIFHDQKVEAFLDVEVEDRRDSRMRQTRQDECFTTKAFAPGSVAERPAQEHLDGDVAVEVVVMGLPYGSHSALSDELEEAVPAQGCSGL